ncbi:MAG: acetolactate synthase small subunit [Firmicutes bacterium]|nr:acetolactate synthase small subunit [Bacillota bacterium]
MRHTLSVMVMNHPGVLARVAGLFSRRGYNIDSVAVGKTEDPEVSRMTIVVDAEDEMTLEQITKQLYKLIDVIKINDITSTERVERELVLIKVSATSANRPEILQIVDIFRARVVDVSEKALIVEATGTQDKIEALIAMLKPFGLKELVRTGKVAMVRAGARQG